MNGKTLSLAGLIEADSVEKMEAHHPLRVGDIEEYVQVGTHELTTGGDVIKATLRNGRMSTPGSGLRVPYLLWVLAATLRLWQKALTVCASLC